MGVHENLLRYLLLLKHYQYQVQSFYLLVHETINMAKVSYMYLRQLLLNLL